VTVDDTGVNNFEESALVVANRGGFGQFKSFTLGQKTYRIERGYMIGVEAVQANGEPVYGILAWVATAQPVWVFVLVAAREDAELGVDLLNRVVDSVVARNL
jgi:hypothetical protein